MKCGERVAALQSASRPRPGTPIDLPQQKFQIAGIKMSDLEFYEVKRRGRLDKTGLVRFRR